MQVIKKTIFPRLISGSKVVIAGKTYTADFWHTHDNNDYYELSGEQGVSFKRTEQQIAEAIKSKLIRAL